jgi:Ca2+-transporting ATPase
MSRCSQSLFFLLNVAALCQQPLLTLSPQRQPWHALEAQECQSLLASGEDGLSTAQVAARLAEHGPNRIELAAGRSPWRILWDQISNVMLLMLLAVAAVSAAVAHLNQRFPKDALAILLIVGLNALLGYLQESRAQQALQSLRRMAQPMVTVCRDGRWDRISSEQLVPGDRIRLEAGDRVPADGRLLEGADLGLREAALTGEAELVEKRSQLVLDGATPVLDRRNCVFQGPEVARGWARNWARSPR